MINQGPDYRGARVFVLIKQVIKIRDKPITQFDDAAVDIKRLPVKSPRFLAARAGGGMISEKREETGRLDPPD